MTDSTTIQTLFDGLTSISAISSRNGKLEQFKVLFPEMSPKCYVLVFGKTADGKYKLTKPKDSLFVQSGNAVRSLSDITIADVVDDEYKFNKDCLNGMNEDSMNKFKSIARRDLKFGVSLKTVIDKILSQHQTTDTNLSFIHSDINIKKFANPKDLTKIKEGSKEHTKLSSKVYNLELKYDGYRVGLEWDGTCIKLHSRNGGNLIDNKLKRHAGPLMELLINNLHTYEVPKGLYDCEILVVDDNNIPVYPNGIRAISSVTDVAKIRLSFFDIRQYQDENIEQRALSDRRTILEHCLSRTDDSSALFLSEVIATDISYDDLKTCFMEYMNTAGRPLEGSVAKCLTDPYVYGYTCGWLKVKPLHYGKFKLRRLYPGNAESTKDKLLSVEVLTRDPDANFKTSAKLVPDTLKLLSNHVKISKDGIPYCDKTVYADISYLFLSQNEDGVHALNIPQIVSIVISKTEPDDLFTL